MTMMAAAAAAAKEGESVANKSIFNATMTMSCRNFRWFWTFPQKKKKEAAPIGENLDFKLVELFLEKT